MNIRNLHITDLTKSNFRTQFFQLLNTTELDEQHAIYVFNSRKEYVVTFVGTESGIPIATASLVKERKFIRGGMLYGHIEDVVVHSEHQGKGLGTEMMKYAMHYAERFCGRVVLECEKTLEQFYHKWEFETFGIAMKRIVTD